MSTNYCQGAEYMFYLMEQERQRFETDRFLKECVLLSEGAGIDEIQTLNEGLGETLKNWATKIAEFLKKLWAKFTGNMDILFQNNEKFLEKYKDTILKKKVKRKWTINGDPATAMKRLTEKIDVSRIDTAQELEAIMSKDNPAVTFAQQMVKGYKPKDDSNASPTSVPGFSEYCINYYYGYENKKQVELGPTNMPMADIYNYCADFKSKILPTLKGNVDNISKKCEDLEKSIGEFVGKTEEAPTTESVDYYFTPDVTYSEVYKTYITEEDAEEKAGGTASVKVASTDADPTTVASNINSLNKNDSNMTDAEKKQADANKEALKKAGAESAERNKKLKDGLLVYQNVCVSMFTAQLTVAEKLYTLFMKIIKAHVSDYLGAADKAEDKQNYAATDYSKNNDEKK